MILKVTQGHRSCRYFISHIWLPISGLIVTLSLSCTFYDILLLVQCMWLSVILRSTSFW